LTKLVNVLSQHREYFHRSTFIEYFLNPVPPFRQQTRSTSTRPSHHHHHHLRPHLPPPPPAPPHIVYAIAHDGAGGWGEGV
jgi:hypothetical protein